MEKNKFRLGFTLAEILITLGVIGVIAAMTIPTLFENYEKKETVSKLQKAISVINQAYRLSFDDLGEPDSAFELGAKQYFDTYWRPYIKVATFCSTYSICGYKSNNPFIDINSKTLNARIVDSANSTRASFIAQDGFFYIIYTGNYSKEGPDPKPYYHVLVDINGATPPNRLGRDVFWLTRYEEKGVHPYGYDTTISSVKYMCGYNSSSWGSGLACADYIRRSGWRIDSSYPWKTKKEQ